MGLHSSLRYNLPSNTRTAGEGPTFEGHREAILALTIPSTSAILVLPSRKKEPKVGQSCFPSVLKPCEEWTIQWFSSCLSRLWGTRIIDSISSQQSEQNCWCHSGPGVPVFLQCQQFMTKVLPLLGGGGGRNSRLKNWNGKGFFHTPYPM